jgi:poly(A) polymerase
MVVQRLRSNGHVAYFAGGCVRDLLLGLDPKDYDVATDAPPNRVRDLFRQTQAVGAAFGVILVRVNKSVVEVATFRAEGKYLDGRHPESVRFTTAEEDAKRRDFTINGLFLDPIENRVIDFVGGQEDLKARRLRAIGNPDERFSEDYLRLLRAVRFASRFDLYIDPATSDAVRKHAPSLVGISPERIAEELRLMLTPVDGRPRAWELLWDFGLIDVVFRFLPAETESKPVLARERSVVMNLSRGAKWFGDVLAAGAVCYRWQCSGGRDIRSFLGRDAALVAAKALRKSLRISNEEEDQLRQITEWLAPLLADVPPTLAIKKRFLQNLYYPAAMEVMEAISLVMDEPQRSKLGALYNELSLLQTADFSPAPFITGDDLTAAGLHPGPAFKKILDAVYDAQLDGSLHDKSAAMDMAMRLAKS